MTREDKGNCIMIAEFMGGKSTIELMEYQDGKLGLQCIWDNSYESEVNYPSIHHTY